MSDGSQLFAKPLVQPLEQRRADTSRMGSMTGRVFRVQGVVEVANPGEALLDVHFPVWFIEPPSPSFGGELPEGEIVTAGSFPTVDVVVARWTIEERGGGIAKYYIGATLAISTRGRAGQKFFVHWQMEAKALRNPLNTGTDLTPEQTI